MINTFNILAQGDGNPYGSLIMMALLFVVMWVVLIRPQQKRQKELRAKQDSLKKGDDVITIGGLHGTVNAVSEKTVSIRVADNQFLKFDKSAIATILGKDSGKVLKEEKK
ncbi:protein translocase subunit yajC [Rubritalea squalenifaciens DSM 18772]|uniref:Sec translocon accessory complex subunit YajC n=1 Tax=Rubritalea squalenifaciens DSM 18772 TaxID=1123071 RepID=A0A1M6KU26_9BACT|nr:preprotein translocase subunit YajC [Rubritalea squalenifaciens]SHJ62364.1 protein translocase subunit yajC [Rubritalea squalenifaciens DSM 18772]